MEEVTLGVEGAMEERGVSDTGRGVVQWRRSNRMNCVKEPPWASFVA